MIDPYHLFHFDGGWFFELLGKHFDVVESLETTLGCRQCFCAVQEGARRRPAREGGSRQRHRERARVAGSGAGPVARSAARGGGRLVAGVPRPSRPRTAHPARRQHRQQRLQQRQAAQRGRPRLRRPLLRLLPHHGLPRVGRRRLRGRRGRSLPSPVGTGRPGRLSASPLVRARTALGVPALPHRATRGARFPGGLLLAMPGTGEYHANLREPLFGVAPVGRGPHAAATGPDARQMGPAAVPVHDAVRGADGKTHFLPQRQSFLLLRLPGDYPVRTGLSLLVCWRPADVAADGFPHRLPLDGAGGGLVRVPGVPEGLWEGLSPAAPPRSESFPGRLRRAHGGLDRPVRDGVPRRAPIG